MLGSAEQAGDQAMRGTNEAMMLVRGELCERVGALSQYPGRAGAAEFVARVDGIRSLAAAYGLHPVVRLAEALERAVGERGRNIRACPVALYVSRLEDAIGCERLDEGASEAILASISVRL
jgi:hypothetical protein